MYLLEELDGLPEWQGLIAKRAAYAFAEKEFRRMK